MTAVPSAKVDLAGLRRLRCMNQTEVGDEMSRTQTSVSRMERQTDMLVSTLEEYVAATGGHLVLVAEYDGCPVRVVLR